MTCSHCNTQIGYFVEDLFEEEEEEGVESDIEEDLHYEEEDIVEMLNIHEDGIESQLKKTFLSQQAPIMTIGYWSYKYNHRKNVEQFHKKTRGDVNDVDLNWSLGVYDEMKSGTYGIDMTTQIPTPYYSYLYTNGQRCDETKAPRETEVRFEPCDNKNVINEYSFNI